MGIRRLASPVGLTLALLLVLAALPTAAADVTPDDSLDHQHVSGLLDMHG